MSNISKQYQTDRNLNTRISIHDKYSTNRQGFGSWIYSRYDIRPGMNILELGCGTGSMWKDQLHMLTGGCTLTLTDFSAGMLESARANLGDAAGISYRIVDIQDIPFSNCCFDIVIANMMLYHVPDLHKGLSEVYRVLKPGGTFYCATYGEHGIVEFVTDILAHLNVGGTIDRSFTLQNGGEILGQHFPSVVRHNYEDSLAVTDLNDFADYIYSLSSLTGTDGLERNLLLAELQRHTAGGVLRVPKEYGMFVCAK